MVKDKFVDIIWNNSTKKRYTDMGYIFTSYGDMLKISIDDLPKYSEVKITAICEQCYKEKEMTFHAYNHITKCGEKKYICRDCYLKNTKVKFSDIKNVADEAGYTLLTKEEDYKNGDTYLEYICPKHGLKRMRASNLYNGKRCNESRDEEARHRYSYTSEEVNKKIENLGGKLLNKDEYINNGKKKLKNIMPSL